MELMKVSKIKVNPNNPRFIRNDDFFKLVESIKEFPNMLEIRPIIIDENNMILGGNMRFRALKELNISEVPVYKVENLTEEQKRLFIVKDNASFGNWNWDLLALDWDIEELNDNCIYPTIEEEPKKNSKFTIKCEDEQQLIELQTYFDTNSKTMDFATFKEKLK